MRRARVIERGRNGPHCRAAESQVSKQHIRHYSVKRNNRGFWQPTATMRLQGFRSISCGPDGPDAWAIAELWNSRWDATRRGEAPAPAQVSTDNLSIDQIEALTIYPRRSVGAAFKEFRATEEWSNDERKAPRTREEWWRVWKWIKPVFADCDPRTVTFAEISAWRQMIEDKVSLREAHRCLKIWRALWKVMAALKYCEREADPSLGVRNTAAKGPARRRGVRAKPSACSRVLGGSSITASRQSSPWHGRPNSRRATCGR
jgi:hypothetical protein